MSKKLKIYERILLGLAFAADELFDLWKAGWPIGRGRSYFDSWMEQDYEKLNLRKNLYKILKTGYIEKIIKNGKPYFRLSNKGKIKLKRDFPLLSLQRKKWDKKWRLVIFDIQEEEKAVRNSLRDKLRELGFGMLQKSIYISPYDWVYDMYEFLKERKLLGKVFVLTAKHELMGEASALTNRVWQIERLEEEYGELWHKIIHLDEAENKDKAIRKIKNQYFKIVQEDPFLPYDLLPSDWLGEEVRKAVVRL